MMHASDAVKWLRETTATLLDRRTDYATLKRCVDALHARLTELTGITDSESNDVRDAGLPSGRAISPWKAGACAIDFMRTAAFMRGVDAAVRELRRRGGERIEIVYAGSGPFALLILPLLLDDGAFPGRLTIIDVHMRSCATVRRLLKLLGLNSVERVVVCADATQYAHGVPIDLAIVETMRRALFVEPQVAITANLVPQLREGGIIVPSVVDVHLARAGSDVVGNVVARGEPRLVLSLSRGTVAALPSLLSAGVTVDLDGLDGRGQTALFTSIVTFGDHSISGNQSGLTVPYLVRDPVVESAKALNVRYVLGPAPRFVIAAVTEHPEEGTTSIA